MRALVIICLLSGVASAQPSGQKVVVGIFTPSVEFGAATARLAYVKALANAIEQNTGLDVDARSYANLAALKADKVDFAIIDGPCVATNGSWRLLASAVVGGGTTRAWALHSSTGAQMTALKGKKLAFVQTGCNDAGFVDNAMLDGEVDAAFFGARVGKADLTAAVAEVASYKTAQAVFAPVGAAKGLTKVFDTGSVPNPGFVDVSGKLPAATVDKVAAAVIGYGGGGAIASWTKPSRDIYTSLAARMARSVKTGMFATPEPVRIDAKDVLLEPPTLRDSALVPVRGHFVRSPGARME